MSTALWIVLIVVAALVLVLVAVLGGLRAHRARTHRHRRVGARARHAEAGRLSDAAAEHQRTAQRAGEVADKEQREAELHRQRALRARKEAEAAQAAASETIQRASEHENRARRLDPDA
jgi:hypothetical protein